MVTGMGIYTSLGRGVFANHKQLSLQQHGLQTLDFLETIHAQSFPFGEIKKSSIDLLLQAALPLNQGFSRTSALGMLALEEAYEQASLQKHSALRIALINATSVGGMCEIEKHYFELIDSAEKFSELSETIDCADCTHRLATQFGIKHFVTTISTACSSSANAIMLGTRMIKAKQADIAICGGTDALTRFTINGFNALKNIDKNLCSPFDANRNGLNLGEGAAYLIIESEHHAAQRNVKPLACISGYDNFNEAFHPTAPNPAGEGAYQVMQRALLRAGLQSSDIHYINAHGTATLTNDESEGNAMKRLFKNLPPFSSTKCYTGHTLAAAGAVEAVFSINALQQQCVYANLNFKNAMPETGLVPLSVFKSNMSIQHVMSNSFAFGGNNASLIFSKV